MDRDENEMLTRVGPGTPAGETLRNYWLPVGFSSEISSAEPKLVRWLCEDLLLFRDEFGRVGLTEPTCPHRGASLDYGWIEAGGIRCCYHGWVFDVHGRCLEQPGEPPESNFKDKIRLKAYPARELGGLIWAYMGKGQPPELPNYHFLTRDDGARNFSGYVRECNYMQQVETPSTRCMRRYCTAGRYMVSPQRPNGWRRRISLWPRRIPWPTTSPGAKGLNRALSGTARWPTCRRSWWYITAALYPATH